MAAKVESPEIIARNIKEWNVPVPDKKYKVVIHCSTYNHESYIEDALKGFVMQKTNFPFCAIIIDDCSTDGTADIVRRYASQYPDIIKPICLGYNHMQHALSRNPYFDCWHEATEYLAQCEGDDYWIDPTKLQQQVDYLDNNPDCSMCFHNAFIHETSNKNCSARIFQPSNKDFDLTFEKALDDWVVPTQSMMYRRSMYKGKPDWQAQIHSGDIALILNLCLVGRVRCINRCMSVYRVVHDGQSATQRIRSAYYLEQTKKLYTSFYNAPTLSSDDKKALDDIIMCLDKLLDYQYAKNNHRYLKLLKPSSMLIMFNIIKLKIRQRYGMYYHMAIKDYFSKNCVLCK